MIRHVNPFNGFEWVQCPSEESFIQDFVRYPVRISKLGEGRDYHRDMSDVIRRNRDAHYPRTKHTIADWDKFRGKPVVIVCPGPSLHRLPRLDVDEREVGIIAINAAARYFESAPPSCVFTFERQAQAEWYGRRGVPMPWIPETPLITCPDASGWLTEMWPDDKRYYGIFDWSEFPQDPRAAFYGEKAVLLAKALTPFAAAHFAVKAGATKIVFVGMDFAIDGQGRYYFDRPANDHYCRHDENMTPVVDIYGHAAYTTPQLSNYAEIMTCCAWIIERSAGIPVLNGTPGGIWQWRKTPFEEAIHGEHKPIVGDDGEYVSREAEGHSGVSQADLSAAVA